MAFVVGDKAAIDRQVSRIPPGFRHMASWHSSDDDKKALVRSLDFAGNIRVHCAKFGLRELQNKIRRVVISGACRTPDIKIKNTIGYQLTRRIDSFFRKFALENKFDMRTLVFVVDNKEMINFLKNGNSAVLKFGKTVDAHTLADCIANANYHGWTVSPNVQENGRDFEQEFHNDVLNEITKK